MRELYLYAASEHRIIYFQLVGIYMKYLFAVWPLLNFYDIEP